jgi:ABC-type dipeptide/oligopeptide/nickel transport system permease subunit
MTDRVPTADQLPEEREEVGLAASSVGRPAAATNAPGSVAVPDLPALEPSGETLTYESGVEIKARSQWAYARMRFFRHRLAVASLIVLILVALVGIFAKQVAPYEFDELDLNNITAKPTLDGKHVFGTDLLGRDYLSRVIYGVRTSLWVALLVATISTAIGTAIGATAGYYGRAIDNVLMRITDLFLVLPFLAILLVLSAFLGHGKPARVGLIVALLLWTFLARIVRGIFLSLREKEFVEAAKAAGASDLRIIVRHILPNCVGPIVVTMTLFVATAILLEAALSFLGFGIDPPTPALGKLIAEGETQGLESWWLVTFPGLVIVIICLAVNFVGDGLRDALDPTQRRTRA